MKFDVVSIVRTLDLGEYHEAYQGQAIHVWVSAPARFLQRRDQLVAQYNRRLQKLGLLPVKARRGAWKWFQFTKVLLPKQKKRADDGAQSTSKGGVRSDVEQAVAAFNGWVDVEFLPAMHEWFAELLSQGADPETHWTAAELDEIHARDTALLAWIKRRSLEMVKAYASEMRERSATPSSDPTGDGDDKEN